PSTLRLTSFWSEAYPTVVPTTAKTAAATRVMRRGLLVVRRAKRARTCLQTLIFPGLGAAAVPLVGAVPLAGHAHRSRPTSVDTRHVVFPHASRGDGTHVGAS